MTATATFLGNLISVSIAAAAVGLLLLAILALYVITR